MRKVFETEVVITTDHVREFLTELRSDADSVNKEKSQAAVEAAQELFQPMADILCAMAHIMEANSTARLLGESYYHPDVDRSVEEAAQYFEEGVGISLVNEQLMINALKQVTDPKTWAELAAESWSYADKLTFIKQMLLGSKWQIKSKDDLIDAVKELIEMA